MEPESKTCNAHPLFRTESIFNKKKVESSFELKFHKCQKKDKEGNLNSQILYGNDSSTHDSNYLGNFETYYLNYFVNG